MTSLSEMFRVFGRIGLLSFGGPAAQIAVMQRELVEERPWMTQDQFLRALSFCMLLPGPEAMQLATYAGWRMRGVPGGVLAGALFVLPGAAVIACLAILYAQYGTRPETEALLLGIKATVIVIVAGAVIRLTKKALSKKGALILAALAFVALFAFQTPFPLVIGCAALWGYVTANTDAPAAPPPITAGPSLFVLLFWTALWLLPLLVLGLMGHDLLFNLALFFAKLAVVTFGGAYAVLAYMAQEVVQIRGWLDATQMVDGLGLAETTPGPLILVTQFVGMLAGHAQGGLGLALVAGVLTLWMTFIPCFLWIFAGAPYVEALLGWPRLASALQAITAAVVGVIANLSLWFAVHVLFDQVTPRHFGPLRPDLPDLTTLNVTALGLIAFAALLMGPAKRGVVVTLIATALAGWALSQIT